MKRKLIAAGMAAAFFAAPAWAQPAAHETHHAPGAQKLLMQRDADMIRGGMMGEGMMGEGMMGGHAAINLTDGQRAKIADLQRELAGKQRDALTRIHDQQVNMHDVFALGSVDEAAARKAYDELTVARKEMFEARLEAAKRIAALFTEEQRKQLSAATPCMESQGKS